MTKKSETIRWVLLRDLIGILSEYFEFYEKGMCYYHNFHSITANRQLIRQGLSIIEL